MRMCEYHVQGAFAELNQQYTRAREGEKAFSSGRAREKKGLPKLLNNGKRSIDTEPIAESTRRLGKRETESAH